MPSRLKHNDPLKPLPVSSQEPGRLAALYACSILNTPPEQVFDNIARMAASVCETPVALISLIDEKRVWYKARFGVEIDETPRDGSFCACAILTPEQISIISDARQDNCYAENPFVHGELGIQFYAGAPLVNQEGYALGTLCVMDRVKRDLNPGQLDSLRLLARSVITELELRRTLAERDDARAALLDLRDSIGIRGADAEREALLKETQSARQLLKSMIDRVSDGLVALDKGWHYVYVNQKAAVMLNRQRPEDLIGKHIWTEYPEGVGQPFHKAYEQAMETQQPVLLVEHYEPWDRWFENRIYPSPDGLTIYFTEITDRKRAEQARLKAEAELRLAVQSANIGLWDWDLLANRVIYSPEWKRQIGYLEDEISDDYQEFESRVHPEDLEKVKNTSQSFIQTPWPNYAVEFRLRHKNGSYRWILAQASLIYNEQNRPVRMIGSHLDITERKQAEEAIQALNTELETRVARRTEELIHAIHKAQEADQLKSAFLATMSHELRTPLNSIIGFTGVLLQGLAGPLNDEQAKQMRMIRDSARHLLNLINDVLDISKIEAGQIELRKEAFDMRQAVENVLRSVMVQCQQKGLALITSFGPGVGLLVSDRRRVEQILLNLLSNAVKFTEHGEIRIECLVRDGWLETRVQDTGIGMKLEDQAKLFNPFQQLDSGLSRRHEGTGLGLSICKSLVELLGGHIYVESQWGTGSTFRFTLPLNH